MDQIPMYKPTEIEPKWQARWEADGIYHADIDPRKRNSMRLPCCLIPPVIFISVTGIR